MTLTRSGELLPSLLPRSRATRGAVTLLFLAGAAGCATEASTPGSTTPTSPGNHAPATPGQQSSRPTTSPTEANCQPLPGAALEAHQRYSGSVALSRLVGQEIRLGAHDCYDSVVIEFGGNASAGELPGVYAHYVDTPKAEPSDTVASVGGQAFLEVTVGSPMYAVGGGDGPSHVSSAAVPGVKEAVLTQNFEGVSTWTLGLPSERPFTVSDVSGTASCPTECLVVDIAK
jgi:hypothetical protein